MLPPAVASPEGTDPRKTPAMFLFEAFLLRLACFAAVVL
jgi:hypothetical protein